MRLVLASTSPRRADLLRSAGFGFDIDATSIDESVLVGESPAAHVRRLAREKAGVTAARHLEAAVLGADTVVVIDDLILGKPSDAADAGRMLTRLQGRTHEVVTGIALWCAGRVEEAVETSAVTFAPMSEDEIAWYVGSGEPQDKAGAYAIQGLGSRFVTRISGSYSNVVGLPMARVYRLLQALGAAGSGI